MLRQYLIIFLVGKIVILAPGVWEDVEQMILKTSCWFCLVFVHVSEKFRDFLSCKEGKDLDFLPYIIII